MKKVVMIRVPEMFFFQDVGCPNKKKFFIDRYVENIFDDFNKILTVCLDNFCSASFVPVRFEVNISETSKTIQKKKKLSH